MNIEKLNSQPYNPQTKEIDYNTSNYGFYQVWAGKTAPNRFVWAYKPLDLSRTVYDPNEMILKNHKKQIQLNSKLNYYITKNPTRTAKDRKSSQVVSLRNIVIDIDNHTKDNDQRERARKLLWYIKKDLIDTNELKPFSKVVFTGRGVQLWYELEPAPASLEWLYKATAQNIADKINELINEYNDLINYEVDYGSSLSPNGLVRLAGINQNNNEKVEIDYNGYIYNLNEFQQTFTEIKAKEKERTTVPNHDLTFLENNLIKGRLQRLLILQSIRINNNRYIGYRNIFTFLYLNTLIQDTEPSKALRLLYKFNSRFPSPLNEKEIKNMYNHLIEHGSYKFNNNTMYGQQWLNISDAEEREITKKITKKRNSSESKKTARKRYKKRVQSDKKLEKTLKERKFIELVEEGTKTNKEIAEILSVSTKTVQRWKKELLWPRD